MSKSPTNMPTWNWPRILKIGLGVVVFGVLMGVPTETDEMWVRALLGAGAGVGLALALMAAMGRKS